MPRVPRATDQEAQGTECQMAGEYLPNDKPKNIQVSTHRVLLY